MNDTNDRIRRLEGLLVLEDARQNILEKYNLVSPGEQALVNGLRKMIEDEKKIAMIEASRPMIVQPTQKSWQDNPWLYFVMGVGITVIGLIIYNAISY